MCDRKQLDVLVCAPVGALNFFNCLLQFSKLLRHIQHPHALSSTEASTLLVTRGPCSPMPWSSAWYVFNADNDTKLRRDCGPGQGYKVQQQQLMDSDRGQVDPHTAVTLAFKDEAVESRFRRWWDDAATAQDLQAASVYLWMVALGTLLYLVIMAFIPSSRPANVDKCTVLIVCSWLGPMVHLLVLRLLPPATYSRNRTHIILLLRAFYIGATSINPFGFGMCGVGRLKEEDKVAVAAALQAPLQSLQSTTAEAAPAVAAAAAAGGHCPLESPFSAMLWRSGVIGLVWWSAAFPLPFRQHVPVQAVSTALYIATLAPTVCTTMQGVRSGKEVLAAIQGFGSGFAAQLLAAMGIPGGAISAASLAAMQQQQPAAGSSSSADSGCVPVLAYTQVVLGLVLPAFVMYCYEARKRRSWWHDVQAASSSSTGGTQPVTDDDSSGGSSTSLAALEAAAMAALTSAEGPLQNRVICHTQVTPGPDKAPGPSCPADTTGAGSSSNSPRSTGSCSSSSSCVGGSNAGGSGSSSSSSMASSSHMSAVCGPAATQHQQQQRHPADELNQPSSSSGQRVGAAAGHAAAGKVSLLCDGESWDVSGRFSKHSAGSCHPPGFTDIFVLAVAVGLSWLILGQVLH